MIYAAFIVAYLSSMSAFCFLIYTGHTSAAWLPAIAVLCLEVKRYKSGEEDEKVE